MGWCVQQNAAQRHTLITFICTPFNLIPPDTTTFSTKYDPATHKNTTRHDTTAHNTLPKRQIQTPHNKQHIAAQRHEPHETPQRDSTTVSPASAKKANRNTQTETRRCGDVTRRRFSKAPCLKHPNSVHSTLPQAHTSGSPTRVPGPPPHKFVIATCFHTKTQCLRTFSLNGVWFDVLDGDQKQVIMISCRRSKMGTSSAAWKTKTITLRVGSPSAIWLFGQERVCQGTPFSTENHGAKQRAASRTICAMERPTRATHKAAACETVCSCAHSTWSQLFRSDTVRAPTSNTGSRSQSQQRTKAVRCSHPCLTSQCVGNRAREECLTLKTALTFSPRNFLSASAHTR